MLEESEELQGGNFVKSLHKDIEMPAQEPEPKPELKQEPETKTEPKPAPNPTTNKKLPVFLIAGIATGGLAVITIIIVVIAVVVFDMKNAMNQRGDQRRTIAPI